MLKMNIKKSSSEDPLDNLFGSQSPPHNSKEELREYKIELGNKYPPQKI